MAKNSLVKNIFILALIVASVMTLTNVTFGIIEVIPDAIPFFGNIDEAVATVILLSAFKTYAKVDLQKTYDELIK